MGKKIKEEKIIVCRACKQPKITYYSEVLEGEVLDKPTIISNRILEVNDHIHKFNMFCRKFRISYGTGRILILLNLGLRNVYQLWKELDYMSKTGIKIIHKRVSNLIDMGLVEAYGGRVKQLGLTDKGVEELQKYYDSLK